MRNMSFILVITCYHNILVVGLGACFMGSFHVYLVSHVLSLVVTLLSGLFFVLILWF